MGGGERTRSEGYGGKLAGGLRGHLRVWVIVGIVHGDGELKGEDTMLS